MNDFNDIVERHRKRGEEIVEKFKQDSERREAKMAKGVERLEDLSMQNFASWRDYLYKYFSVILLLIGATGVLQSEKFNDPWFKAGIFTTLVGVFIGYVFINIYFYIERKWLQAQNIIGLEGTYSLHEHPKAKTGDIREAIILHQLDYIEQIKKRLEEAKANNDKKMIRHYKKVIRINKRLNFSIKFTGEQFGIIEHIWISGTILSLFLTISGIAIVFLNIR
ncbi:MAG: hypothetical protein V1892_02615 [bacterium]